MVGVRVESSKQTQQPDAEVELTKRRRASKPKVKTGCLTCKIRRVKCGEEKPSCIRCTSTGRTCDGYNQITPHRKRAPEDLRTAIRAAQERYLQACSDNSALRFLRPLMADIDGTEMERRYFHRFRRLGEKGLTLRIGKNCTFWTSMVPQLSHSSAAVKHAVVALGSAHHIYDAARQGKLSKSVRRELEIFTIQQYTMAISRLHCPGGDEAGGNSESGSTQSELDRIMVTLFCCMAFVCIESLRDNWRPALTHLQKGLRIIQSLPPSALRFIAAPTPTQPGGPTDGVLSPIAYIIRIFTHWEIGCVIFAGHMEQEPVVSISLYEGREREWASRSRFDTPTDAHQGLSNFCRAGMTLIWQAQNGKVYGEDGWVLPSARDRHDVLLRWSEVLADEVSRFMKLPAAASVRAGGERHYAFCIDLLFYKTVAGLLYLLWEQRPCPGDTTIYSDILAMAAQVRRMTCNNQTGGDPDLETPAFTLDYSIIPSIYLVVCHCPDEAIRAEALQLLLEYPHREYLWDSLTVRDLLVQLLDRGPKQQTNRWLESQRVLSTSMTGLYEQFMKDTERGIS